MWPTWADREDYEGPPAGLIKCPCCKRMKAADMVYRIAHLDESLRNQIAAILRLDSLPEYICDGSLATLQREVGFAELPGTE